jgi:hypothetical protein
MDGHTPAAGPRRAVHGENHVPEVHPRRSARTGSAPHRGGLVVAGLLALSLSGFRDGLRRGDDRHDANPGTSSAAPWRTIGKASATMVAGDVVRISPGTYNETLQPVANGTTGNRITYVGNLANPAATVVNAIQFYGQDNISIKGIQVSGDISILANTSGNSADRDSILCGSVSMNGRGNVIARTIGIEDAMELVRPAAQRQPDANAPTTQFDQTATSTPRRERQQCDDDVLHAEQPFHPQLPVDAAPGVGLHEHAHRRGTTRGSTVVQLKNMQASRSPEPGDSRGSPGWRTFMVDPAST